MLKVNGSSLTAVYWTVLPVTLLTHRHAFGQQRQLLGVAAVQALEKARMRSGGGVDGSADGQIRGHGLCGKERRQ